MGEFAIRIDGLRVVAVVQFGDHAAPRTPWLSALGHSNITPKLAGLGNQDRAIVVETHERQLQERVVSIVGLNAAHMLDRLILRVKFGNQIARGGVPQLKKSFMPLLSWRSRNGMDF